MPRRGPFLSGFREVLRGLDDGRDRPLLSDRGLGVPGRSLPLDFLSLERPRNFRAPFQVVR